MDRQPHRRLPPFPRLGGRLHIFPAFIPMVELLPWLLTAVGALAGASQIAFWKRHRKRISAIALACFIGAAGIYGWGYLHRPTAEEGTLSVMVGADQSTFVKLKPLIETFATDITHCGPVGSGQVVKILNNMVLMQTVVALAEALEAAKRAGLDGRLLFETLMKGSADSFALRNHGMKAMLVDTFPERAFSTQYARKDLGYALDLARSVDVRMEGAELADRLLAATTDQGFGDLYWPVVSRVIASRRQTKTGAA